MEPGDELGVKIVRCENGWLIETNKNMPSISAIQRHIFADAIGCCEFIRKELSGTDGEGR